MEQKSDPIPIMQKTNINKRIKEENTKKYKELKNSWSPSPSPHSENDAPIFNMVKQMKDKQTQTTEK